MHKKSNIKILFLSNDCDYFISHRLPVAIASRETGYDVHVAGPFSSSVAKITAYGFSYHEIDMCAKISNPFKELSTIVAIIRLYRSVRPDLVHLVAIKSVLYGSIAALFEQVPALVNAVTGLGYLFISDRLKVKILRFITMKGLQISLRHKNCRVLFQNWDDSKLFIDSNVVSPDKVTIIRGSGVDVNQFFPRDNENGIPVVVLPSRMLWDKGVAEFVEAAGILKNEGIQARFVLVGDTYEANPATIPKARLSEWNSSGVIEWWGHRNDMHDVFRQAHIVCLPSYREGLPKVLIEAAACGRPIVTTDVPGCREVVLDGENGYLVPVKNSSILAAKLKILINNRNLREQMGIKGRELAVNEFAIDKIIFETLNCYKELLKCQRY